MLVIPPGFALLKTFFLYVELIQLDFFLIGKKWIWSTLKIIGLLLWGFKEKLDLFYKWNTEKLSILWGCFDFCWWYRNAADSWRLKQLWIHQVNENKGSECRTYTCCRIIAITLFRMCLDTLANQTYGAKPFPSLILFIVKNEQQWHLRIKRTKQQHSHWEFSRNAIQW